MKNLTYLILMLFVLVSCKETSQTELEKDGVSLTCPKGWEITDEDSLDGQGYYLSIEKAGFNSSGLITITWINNEFDKNEWINSYKDELRNNFIYKNSNLSFGGIIENKFNNINSTSVSFKVSILGVKHEGEIHVFSEKNKTFSILKQEAIEDKTKNINGFGLIEQSLKIK